MAGYTRQSAAQIVTGEVAEASDFNNEFNQIEAAFDESTGHAHDGTSNEGPTIKLLSDADGDTSVEVESTTDEDTIRLTALTVEAATITSTSVTANVTLDVDGNELVLDADGDTSITADTDDQIDIKIAGADDFRFTTGKFEVLTGSVIDVNGNELILDADGDTSITADTDDQIDIKIAGADDFRFSANSFNILSGSTLTVGSGATLDVSSGTLTLANNQISGDKVDGGTISNFASTGIDDNSISTTLTLTSGNKIGVGTTSPDGKLHVHSASAGVVTAASGADDLVVENSGTGGISILTPDNTDGNIYFGSPSDQTNALIRWDDLNDDFIISSHTSAGSVKLNYGTNNPGVELNSTGNFEVVSGDLEMTAGNVDLVAGDLRLQGASSGVDFSGVGTAVNILTDFRNNAAFTPTIFGGTVAGSPTYSLSEGAYAQVGNLIYLTLRVRISNKGGATGAVRIGNLPAGLASVYTAALSIGFISNLDNWTDRDPVAAAIPSGQSYIQLYRFAAGTGYSFMNFSDVTDTFDVAVSGFFIDV